MGIEYTCSGRRRDLESDDENKSPVPRDGGDGAAERGMRRRRRAEEAGKVGDDTFNNYVSVVVIFLISRRVFSA